MKIVPLEKVEVRNRQRSQVETGPLTELRESILARGLLHPPVVWHDAQTDKYVLVAGERRFRAIQTIAKADGIFFCDGATVTAGEIPITEVIDLDPRQLMETELEENIIRVDLPWQDRTRALAAIHQQRQSENPKQTKMDTARELSQKGGVDGGGGKAPTKIHKAISQALIISERLNDPKISKARNANEAFALVLQHEEKALQAELARRKIAAGGSRPEIEIQHGSLFDILPEMGEGLFDLICVDPPYGIDAGRPGFRGRTVHHHNYADDADTGERIAQEIFEQGWRVSKSRANLFLFCDIKRWYDLRNVAARIGWEVFPRPIIWQKSESEGLAPWGRQGFRLTYETILYATKGGRGLITSPVDIISIKRVARSLREHAAEKPVTLLRLLVECSTLPGDFVLDPCCGSGSTLVACRELGRRAVGIEVDKESVDLATANVFDAPKGSDSEGSDSDVFEEEEPSLEESL